jgi:2-iminobutanoate/2-iminopropanoate deaminase
MRLLKIAVLTSSLVAALSAQTGSKQFVRPMPGQTPPYSLAIKTGGVIYVAGQLPTDDKGNIVEGDVAAQAAQVFKNLRTILQQAGSSLDSVVSSTLMLQNATDFPAVDQVYRQQFKGDLPARTTIIGSMVRPGALLEIAVTAVPTGTERKLILPAGWMKPTSPYSYAIQSGDTLYISGLVSRNAKDNSQVQGDIATQVKTIMGTAQEILKTAGMTYSDIAAARVALRDITQWQAMNDVYRTYWEKDRPARVSCQAAPPGTFDVEITFIAVKGSAPREVIIPPAADGSPGQVGPNYSPAIRIGNRLFVSGGTGTTDANAADMKAQTTETLTRLGRSLKAAGFDFKDVVASDVFITDVERFNEMNEAYRPVFPTDPPVRATVGVGKLANQNALVEIMVTAAK